MSPSRASDDARPSEGWSLGALLFGPFWYLWHGVFAKGLGLLAIAVLTAGLAAPVVWIYCGWRGRSDVFERELSKMGAADIWRL
jgi:hypothetical protein